MRWLRLSLLIGLAALAAPLSAQSVVNVPCSVPALRAAIMQANVAGGATLSLASRCLYLATDSMAKVGNTTDELALGFYFGPNGFPLVNSTITIEGNGSTIRRDANAPPFRLFMVAGPSSQVGPSIPGYPATGSLTLRNLTLSGGLARGGDGADGGGGAPGEGGAILAAGTVLLENVTLSGNQAIGGNGDDSTLPGHRLGGGGGGFGGNGGKAGTGGGGGGGGFVGNGGDGTADGAGGGGGALGNGASAASGSSGAGGSITAASGTTPGTNDGLAPWGIGGTPEGGIALDGPGGGGAGNKAGKGGDGEFGGGGGGGTTAVGGISTFGGGGGGSISGDGGAGEGGGSSAAVGGRGGNSFFGGTGAPGARTSTTYGGIATATVGGGGAGVGGAISLIGGTLSTVNVTISGNKAIGGTGGNPGQALGGAIFAGGNVTLVSTTIAGNTGTAIYAINSTVTIGNTILADTTGGNDCASEPVTTINETSTNLIEKPGNCAFRTTDVIGADPRLLPLANNGGPAFTQALPAQSPAVQRGQCTQITDERGVIRRNRPTCDIGAYELDRVTLTIEVIGQGQVIGTGGFFCDGFCTFVVPRGTVISFDETPAMGWTFAGWGGACAGFTDCQVTVQSDTTVTATFLKEIDAGVAASDAGIDALLADAGPADAGSDAGPADGPIAIDAGAVDAGPPDAAPDAHIIPDGPRPDAMAAIDARLLPDSAVAFDAKITFDALGGGNNDAPGIVPLDRGCSCGVGGHSPNEAPSALLLFGLVALVVRRTRKR